jgi:hypothetical protein
MFAIASLSQGKNGVRSHVVKYRKGVQPFGSETKIAQVDTTEYRRLHKMWNDGSVMDLMSAFNDKPYDYIIDIQSMTLHKEGCEHLGESTLYASIIDVEAAGLTVCECVNE